MKRIFLIIVLLSLSLSLQAKVGIRAGYSYSNLHDANAGAGSGYTIGLSLSASRINIEANYCTKGAVIRNAEVVTQDRDIYTYAFNIVTGYFEIPLLYDIFRYDEKNIKFTCYAGMAISIGITDNSYLSDKQFIGELPSDVMEIESFYEWNYDKGGLPYEWSNSSVGLRLGAKYQFNMSSIGLRYNYEFWGGLSAVNEIIMKEEKFHSIDLYFSYNF